MKFRKGLAALLGIGMITGGMTAQGDTTSVPVQELAVVEEESNPVDPQQIEEEEMYLDENGEAVPEMDENAGEHEVRPPHHGYRHYRHYRHFRHFRTYHRTYRHYRPYRPYRPYHGSYHHSYYGRYGAADMVQPNGENIPQPQMDK